jgi:ATPase subunit of ABC transporter with duplicated ATPase domains
MISITVSNATLILGAHTIFRDLNWEIQHDQKIGLIGPNGAGKSSLLKLITEEHTPEKGGTVIRARGVTVGYLPQDPEFDPERTALSLALEGNPRVAEIDEELIRLEGSDSATRTSTTTPKPSGGPSIPSINCSRNSSRWAG